MHLPDSSFTDALLAAGLLGVLASGAVNVASPSFLGGVEALHADLVDSYAPVQAFEAISGSLLL